MEKYLAAVLVVQDLGITEQNITSYELSTHTLYGRWEMETVEKLRIFVKPQTEKHLDWQKDEDNWLKFETREQRNGFTFLITLYSQID